MIRANERYGDVTSTIALRGYNSAYKRLYELDEGYPERICRCLTIATTSHSWVATNSHPCRYSRS